MRHLVVAVGVIALLAGCSGAANSGGDTTCREFVAMRPDDMDAAVARMLKERNGRNASTMDVVNTRIEVLGACEPAEQADARIGDLA